MQRGMAPPQGLALSSFRSNKTVSIPFSCAKISAAQAPDGPPPTTATLYFMQRAEEESVEGTERLFPSNEEGEKAATVVDKVARVRRENFILIDLSFDALVGVVLKDEA
jgi:hypothetical protein